MANNNNNNNNNNNKINLPANPKGKPYKKTTDFEGLKEHQNPGLIPKLNTRKLALDTFEQSQLESHINRDYYDSLLEN